MSNKVFLKNQQKRNSAPVSRVLYCYHLSVNNSACHLSSPQVTLRLKRSTLHRICTPTYHKVKCRETDSGEQPSNGGLHELAASSGHSLTITRQLVVSYTTFSPLPYRSKAVVFFCPYLLSPIASTFRSGAPYAARTFLSHHLGYQRQAGTLFQVQK